MSNSNQTVKAIRATIKLGNIELDVYQMPDGKYKMSRNGLRILDVLIGDSTGKKYAEPLLAADKSSGELVKIEGQSASAKLMSLETFSAIILEYAKLGNSKCQAVVFASFAESLERRADVAFTVERTEIERNEVFASRQERLANYVKQSQEQGYYVNHVWDASITSGENQALADLLSLLSLKGQIEYELSSNKGKLSLKGQDNLKQAKKLEAKLSDQGILPDGAECPAKSPEAIESERKVASFYSQLENSQRQLSTMLADSRFMQCDLGKSEVNRLSQTIEAAKAGLKTQGISC